MMEFLLMMSQNLLRHGYYNVLSNSSFATLKHLSTHEQTIHAKHCIEYIRQTILCSSDSSLEFEDGTTRQISGTGSLHICRDFDGLFNWVEKLTQR